MVSFRSLTFLFVFTLMFSVTAFADRILTFQPTGSTVPIFQPTDEGVPVGDSSYLATPPLPSTNPQFTLNYKVEPMLSGSVLTLFQNTLPTNPVAREVDWVAKGTFSVKAYSVRRQAIQGF